MIIKLNHLSKAYNSHLVLSRLDLELDSSQPNCLMSPSGSGKTTLLRILAGLETADQGRAEYFQDDGSPLGRPPRISMVFQENRLCEDFSASDNVYMVCSRFKSRAQVQEELSYLLPSKWLDQPVRNLSGGMKRRVALCRALSVPFDLLLLDEPYTGLDEETRRTAIDYTLQRLNGRLVINATHDLQEARLLGGRIIHLPLPEIN